MLRDYSQDDERRAVMLRDYSQDDERRAVNA
jgi:hypothetical protein